MECFMGDVLRNQSRETGARLLAVGDLRPSAQQADDNVGAEDRKGRGTAGWTPFLRLRATEGDGVCRARSLGHSVHGRRPLQSLPSGVQAERNHLAVGLEATLDEGVGLLLADEAVG